MSIKILQAWKDRDPNILLQILVTNPHDLRDGTSLTIFAMSAVSLFRYQISLLSKTTTFFVTNKQLSDKHLHILKSRDGIIHIISMTFHCFRIFETMKNNRFIA